MPACAAAPAIAAHHQGPLAGRAGLYHRAEDRGDPGQWAVDHPAG